MRDQTYCYCCTKPRNKPWRSYDPDTGVIVHGCVDAAHDFYISKLHPDNEDYKWHHRPEAGRIRVAAARGLYA